MKTRIKSSRIIADDTVFDGYLYIEDGKITDITRDGRPADACFDYGNMYVSPGFIDIHTHGGGGFAFADSDEKAVASGCDFHLAHGTTSIMPTVSASRFCDMMRSLENIAAAVKKQLSKANILGAHLEGPYLSAAQCGAQCPDFITPPVKDEYIKAVQKYGDLISRWTYAPENDAGGDFCRFLSANGIVPSAGHTDAGYVDMQRALQNGCRLTTHLYSCTSTVVRKNGFRHIGVTESTFLSDGIYAEIIADGCHLPPELIKMIVKIKGSDRVILCTDSLAVAGSDITSGVMCGTAFIVEDGVAKLADRTAFAGSIATADVLIRTLTKKCGFCVAESVKMLTKTPARLFSLNKGILKNGYDADICVFDDDINVKAVFVNGKKML